MIVSDVLSGVWKSVISIPAGRNDLSQNKWEKSAGDWTNLAVTQDPKYHGLVHPKT